MDFYKKISIWHNLQALYDLKQVPYGQFDHFSAFLLQHGLFCSLADPLLVILHFTHGTLILLLYIDDMLLTSFTSKFLNNFIQLLHTEFAMKDLNPFHHFLGIQMTHTSATARPHLSQAHYALIIIEKNIYGGFQAHEQ